MPMLFGACFGPGFSQQDETMEAPVAFADLVRQSIQQTLLELGCDTSEGVQESILIRHGSYCGRRFQCAGGYAVWFIEEHQLKFFDADGALVRVCPTPGKESEPPATLPMTTAPRRRAA